MPLEETLRQIRPLDRSTEAEMKRTLDSLTKPQGSLGRLEELACRVSRIQGKIPPELGPKLLFVFAADHGISEEGVSAYPKEVTAQMTYNFLNGGAAINVLARHYGVDVEVVDMGVDHDFPPLDRLRSHKIKRGTNNFLRGPAMTREEALQSVETGIRLAQEAASRKVFLLGAGDMGIGNTSSAAAIFCALTGLSARDATGRGTGIDANTWERKVTAIEDGLRLNQPDPKDPIDVLSRAGGLEIGAITGLILGAAVCRIPMVLDGYICSSAALLACRLNADIRDVLFASHLSAENGHRPMLNELRLAPLFDLQMRLGEGTGACMAMGWIEAGVKVAREMATFDSAGVAGKIL
ncbi:MAG: nicotinate-nucleotide--dimethylbenzimidazole phosphoribosyltransferase [Deltaproteobacteria bacterium]|nr:nicotinate-nucleotide--dimethylbenzimidazole phosphoribosyltransferase [Deltaproteobacteria bacterium]